MPMMALPVELLDYIFDIAIELIGSEDLGLRGSWSKRTRRSRRDPCLQARQEMSSLVLVSVYWAQRIRKKRFGAKVGLLNEEQATQFWDWARPSRVGRLECAGLIKHLKIRALPLWGEAESSGEQMFIDTISAFRQLEILEVHTYCAEQHLFIPIKEIVRASNLKSISLVQEPLAHAPFFDIFLFLDSLVNFLFLQNVSVRSQGFSPLESSPGPNLDQVNGRLVLNGPMDGFIVPMLQRFTNISELELCSSAMSFGVFHSSPFSHLAPQLTSLALRELWWKEDALRDVIQTPMPKLRKIYFQLLNFPDHWMKWLQRACMPALESITLEVSSYRHITPPIIQDMACSGKFPKLRTISLEYNPEFETDLEAILFDDENIFDAFNEELLATKDKLEEKGVLLAYKFDHN